MTGSSNQRSVLFVCLGNICRSPAAEGIADSLAQQHGWESRIKIDSAGTAGYHVGKQADSRMIAAAQRRGVELHSRSRKLQPEDLMEFDLVVAMDRENLSDILALCDCPRSSVKLLSEFLDDQWPADVPDPYYGGEEGFETVLDMLEAACPKILESLVA